MKTSSWRACGQLLTLAFISAIAYASAARGNSLQSSPAAKTRQAPTESTPDRTIKVDVKEVLVPVTVLDSHGEMLLDLPKEEFRIFDNGAEQSIEHFDIGGQSLAVALVIETSSHLQSMAPAIRGMGSIFTETVMALEGRGAVITYDSTVEVRQAFTADQDAVARAIRKVEFTAPEMRLYDAMSAAVDLLKMEPPNFRRVMLIVGESRDETSEAKLGIVLRSAQLAGISIYAIGPSSTAADLRYGSGNSQEVPLPKPLPRSMTKAPPRGATGESYFDLLTPAIWLLSRGSNEIKNRQLELAVAATGGVHYSAVRERTIQQALDKIGGELHAQYLLTYNPDSGSASGFHRINVTVARPNSTVRARPGYFIEPAAAKHNAPSPQP